MDWRDVRGGIESSQLMLLEQALEGLMLSPLDDRWVWDLNGEGTFRVKDVRTLLDDHFLPKESTATRWVSFVPIKVNVFAWRVSLDRLPTRKNLVARGVQITDLRCPICDSQEEDVSHLFFSCCMANNVCKLVCRWWNISHTELSSYAEWLGWFESLRLNSKLKKVLEGVFFVVWWSIWVHRNQLLFSSQSPRKDVLFDDIVSRSFSWIHSRCNRVFSWDCWLQRPYLISL